MDGRVVSALRMGNKATVVEKDPKRGVLLQVELVGGGTASCWFTVDDIAELKELV